MKGATISAQCVTLLRVTDKTIKWIHQIRSSSTLSPSGDNSVLVTGRNSTNKPEWVPVGRALPCGQRATSQRLRFRGAKIYRLLPSA